MAKIVLPQKNCCKKLSVTDFICFRKMLNFNLLWRNLCATIGCVVFMEFIAANICPIASLITSAIDFIEFGCFIMAKFVLPHLISFIVVKNMSYWICGEIKTYCGDINWRNRFLKDDSFALQNGTVWKLTYVYKRIFTFSLISLVNCRFVFLFSFFTQTLSLETATAKPVPLLFSRGFFSIVVVLSPMGRWGNSKVCLSIDFCLNKSLIQSSVLHLQWDSLNPPSLFSSHTYFLLF